MPEGAQTAVRISPAEAMAGQLGTWTVTIIVGPEGIKVGGALRIRPPQRGMVRWQVGKVTAEASRPGAACEVRLFDCHPISYHWRHAPIIQVDLYGTELVQGDTVAVTIGEGGGYSRGYFVPARAQEHAQDDAQWDVWMDAEGNKSLQREQAIKDPWQALAPVLMQVRPAKVAGLALTGAQPLPGEEQTLLLVVARDRYDNLCDEYTGQPLVVTGGKMGHVEALRGRALAPLRCPKGAVARPFAVDPVAGICGTSNPVCPGLNEDHAVFFGDLHVMTGEGVIASALKDTRYAYQWAAEVAGLDFCAVTNKADRWAEDVALDDEFYTPGEFVTIPGIEAGFTIGHKNVYFPTTAAEAPQVSSVQALFASVRDTTALVIPHHTSVYSESSRQTFWTEHDFSTHDPQFERLIEVCQNRGSMEREQVGGNVYFGGTGSSVWSALQRGMKVGFVGGTDNHRAQPGEPRASVAGLIPGEVIVGGLTAVVADELTREGVWGALYSRRCYATQGQRTLLRFELADHMMGSIIQGEQAQALHDRRTFRAWVIGDGPVCAVELVRSDGHIQDLQRMGLVDLSREFIQAEWQELQTLSDIPKADDAVFYYLRVTEQDGRMAWSSPIWIIPGADA